jgi:FdhD protein
MDSSRQQSITVFNKGKSASVSDLIAVEEPLEIRLRYHDDTGSLREQSISVTMRTPGNDINLALGFLFSESIIDSHDQIRLVKGSGSSESTGPGEPLSGSAGQGIRSNCNVVTISLQSGVKLELEKLQRNFYTTSSCGVCSKSSLEAIRVAGVQSLTEDHLKVSPTILEGLPEKLGAAQSIFSQTGGLHAAAFFDSQGSLLDIQEDVGRHNAVDKLIGNRLLEKTLPVRDILMVSGRTSFEIVQKALRAGVPFLAAISAPSTLAITLAAEFGLTLVGFLRGERFNVYSGSQRLYPDS